jgi:hypothetical protein
MAEFIILLPLSMVVFTAGMVALAWRSLERSNRVSPSVRSAVPLHWRWSYRYAARLHRHVQHTTAGLRACVALGGELGIDDLVLEIERHACAVDQQLAIAGRMPQPTRRRLLRELRAEVLEIDAMVERVIRLRRAWSGAVPSARTLAPVAERVDALEAALRDVARLDTTRGLDQPVERPRRLPLVD